MGDRVKVTIHSTYTEWVDPDDFDDPSLDAIRESTLNMAPEIVCNALTSTRYGGTFEVIEVDVTDPRFADLDAAEEP